MPKSDFPFTVWIASSNPVIVAKNGLGVCIQAIEKENFEGDNDNHIMWLEGMGAKAGDYVVSDDEFGSYYSDNPKPHATVDEVVTDVARRVGCETWDVRRTIFEIIRLMDKH